MGNSPLSYHSNWVIFVSKHRNIYRDHLENARGFAKKTVPEKGVSFRDGQENLGKE
jgi:hypothetical protein